MKDGVELIKVLVTLAWPIIVAVVLWKLFPTVRQILQSKSFSVKFAGVEVSVQDATDKLSLRVEDLQNQVLALKEGVKSASAPAATPAKQQKNIRAPGSILWVDDKPENNAFEIGQLEASGVRVLTSQSTQDALEVLRQNPDVAAVLSDMGRNEDGLYRRHAGLLLLQAMRQGGFSQPFLVCTTSEYARGTRDAVIGAGGSGATSSPVEVLEWIYQKLAL